jgi:hypothetical protein
LLTFDAVTTYAPQHWESHAKRCVESFHDYWNGMSLRQFTDEDLDVSSEWLPEFKKKHAWRPTHNYRFDAVRFAHKVAAIELAYRLDDSDVLVWIDADCVTHASVDAAWLSGLLGFGEFGYLKRTNKYPECGFMMIRRCMAMDRFISELVDVYQSGRIFNMAEWHDSWAIEQVRQQMNLCCVSLSGEFEDTGHPLINGPLGARLDHLKGGRKAIGRSRPQDLKTTRNETYWSARGQTI